MLVSIQGTLVSATPLLAIIETHGLGYEVHVPVTTAEKLPRLGSPVKLHTVAIYREDAQSLYGFATLEERDLFKLLIEHVSGVGPKVALTIMSRLALPVLRSAIVSGDVGLLSKCPGIGKKTAERLVVELKDKIGLVGGPAAIDGGAAPTPVASAASATPGAAGLDTRMHDAVLALTALGYKVPDAEKAVRRAAGAGGNAAATTEELVKRALAG
ncbi:MAG: Holliday junction branch migration protein RuvA [Opitutaceae bacterium]|nr:Holliday junction branch migration protein RuvA [Opitutaceae bacterium]